MLMIDVAHVFSVFGGPRGLLNSLDRHQPDHGTNYNAVQMWLQRGNIPSKWIGAILYCCEREGHECFEFLVDPSELC
jgi:hypothetical protein